MGTSSRSERQDDLVWRLQLGGHCVYVYLLLEFQSRSDRWMALRMQTYVGLLYQDLVKRKEVGPGNLLPPLVFYNGADPWRAALELGELIHTTPAGLAHLQASQRYALVDQHRLDPARLAAHGSLLALLFRLELSDTPDVLREVLPLLSTWMADAPQAPLRRSVKLWLARFMAREMPDVAADDLLACEGGVMAERKFATWQDFLEDRGMQRGREQGKAEGERIALRKIIEARFGALAPTQAALIAQLPETELEQWITKAASAATLQALVDGAAAPSP
ncbi:MAG TPA: Rpn family recombination-promoting nuclease/putative transposase [Telluria sp.]|nr:Rpn family recombination-promoting nuclease/putative transposase [Telluria sp.]